MPEYECYDNDSTCPKCGQAGASSDFAGSIHPTTELIVRQCQHCGFTRGELPVDHDDCPQHP